MDFSDELKVVKQTLSLVWGNKLSIIFQNKTILSKILILIFNESQLFILSKIPIDISKAQKFSCGYYLYEIKHNISFRNNDFSGWYACIKKREILKYLPENFVNESQLIWPRISGPTSTLFLKFQNKLKCRTRPLNPYITKESYMATVIHEFGHAYFDSLNLSWHGIKEQNLKLLKTTFLLLSKKKANLNKIKIILPLSHIFSELFAFCTEYFSAILFWPTHRKMIDEEIKYYLPQIIKQEKNKDLNFQTSIFDSDIHFSSAVLGIQIIAKNKSSWTDFFGRQKNPSTFYPKV